MGIFSISSQLCYNLKSLVLFLNKMESGTNYGVYSLVGRALVCGTKGRGFETR